MYIKIKKKQIDQTNYLWLKNKTVTFINQIFLFLYTLLSSTAERSAVDKFAV